MSVQHQSPTTLRAEARLLTTAGLLLLGLGFPITLTLVAIALGAGSPAPLMPLAIGAPPIMLGYLACHFASQRLLRAKSIEASDKQRWPNSASEVRTDSRSATRAVVRY